VTRNRLGSQSKRRALLRSSLRLPITGNKEGLDQRRAFTTRGSENIPNLEKLEEEEEPNEYQGVRAGAFVGTD